MCLNCFTKETLLLLFCYFISNVINMYVTMFCWHTVTLFCIFIMFYQRRQIKYVRFCFSFIIIFTLIFQYSVSKLIHLPPHLTTALNPVPIEIFKKSLFKWCHACLRGSNVPNTIHTYFTSSQSVIVVAAATCTKSHRNIT